jgi:formylglycine-generating enzyme required for sulfatase activity
MTPPIKIFLSYAHADGDDWLSLKKHLSPQVNEGLIEIWYDEAIAGGDPILPVILEKMDEADLILLLLSADFWSSAFIRDHEYRRALDRQARSDAVVVPILLRDCDFRSSELKALKVLPDFHESIYHFDPIDEGFRRAAEGIRESARALRDRRAARRALANLGNGLAETARAARAQRSRRSLYGVASLLAGLAAVTAYELLPPKGDFVRVEPGPAILSGGALEEVTRPFEIQRTEVTQEQWAEVFAYDDHDNSPARYACGEGCPVHHVSWYEALAFLNLMSKDAGYEPCYELENCRSPRSIGAGCPPDLLRCEGEYACDVRFRGPDCEGYRLPTPAEWVRAARAETKGPVGEGIELAILGERNAPALDPLVWYGGNSGVTYSGAVCETWPEVQSRARRCGPHPVARKAPNAWGLFDMLGNVWELTGDAPDEVRDHGGGWRSAVVRIGIAVSSTVSPAYRGDDLGFRPARTLPR